MKKLDINIPEKGNLFGFTTATAYKENILCFFMLWLIDEMVMGML
jgi:hypothetical protein